ncbi:MAG: hypothetical protein H7Y01_02095 [Ferruginibacter sp.]|nr:hypothetical protein [Chitinophagaceae bacterium]
MIRQNPLTLLTPVKTDQLSLLNSRLEIIKKELQAGTDEEFKKLSTVHYARWVILSEESFRDKTAIPVPVRLIFTSNYDGAEENHLDEIVTVFTKYMDHVYECCEGYPELSVRTPETRKQYLKQWGVKTAAFYPGAPGRSLKQVLQEDALRDHVWEFINKNKWNGDSAVQIHKAIQQEIDSKTEFDWSRQKARIPTLNWLGIAMMGLIMLILLPVLLIWMLIVHFFYERREKTGETTLSQLKDKHVNRLEEDEDLCNQNQFTQAVVMKPGMVRLITFQAMMLLARGLVKNIFVKGELMGIPTIHFARWVLIDKNKHVLFFSNFDGSWQQYLGDFIDKSGWGLTGIFSNTVNFPKTNFLLTGGAYDEEHFLAWSRGTQLPTQVWYSAYPHLSIKNVINNTHIRNDLRKNLTEEQAQSFLKRF